MTGPSSALASWRRAAGPQTPAGPWTRQQPGGFLIRRGASPGGGDRVVRGVSRKPIGLLARGRGSASAVGPPGPALAVVAPPPPAVAPPLSPRGPSLVLRLRGVGSPGCDVTLWRPEKATVPCPEFHPRALSSSSSLDLRAPGAEFPPRLPAPSFRAPAAALALEATLPRLPWVAGFRPETGNQGGPGAASLPSLPLFQRLRK